MSVLHDVKRASHGSQRRASGGAAITLVCGVGEYTASFECAKRIAEAVGHQGLKDIGDGIFESIPVYRIPLLDMPAVCHRLAAQFSIALVDLFCEKEGSQFALVWKIDRRDPEPVQAGSATSLEDY